jgi:BirA family biotin operon repressor/biotin-[acetyl-CoA-carboxylase] ligase
MNDLDANVVRRPLSEQLLSQLDQVEIFQQIDSTNSYLLQQVAPDPGRFRVALADHQTAGRGRHYRSWQSPPGTGLCLSIAYTFAAMPKSLPSLTLSLGVGVARALASMGISGISLKWPNDIVAMDGKLGGMLAETRSNPDGGIAVVAGIGLNVDIRERLDFGAEHDWALAAVDLKSISANPPSRDELAGVIVEQLYAAIIQFEEKGFDCFVDEWRKYDWLFGKMITVDTPSRQISGVAAGVDAEGALLVDTNEGQRRIISGSIVMASRAGLDT